MGFALTSEISIISFIAHIAGTIHRQTIENGASTPKRISDVNFKPLDVCNYAIMMMSCRNAEPVFNQYILKERFRLDWNHIFEYNEKANQISIRDDKLPPIKPNDPKYKKTLAIWLARAIDAPLYEYKYDDLRFMGILD